VGWQQAAKGVLEGLRVATEDYVPTPPLKFDFEENAAKAQRASLNSRVDVSAPSPERVCVTDVC
jgi:hypothetical protein